VRSGDTAHQENVVEYIGQAAGRPEIANRLAASRPPIRTEEFVSRLERSSEYNFMYLTRVFDDLAADDGPLDLSALDDLPRGLEGYYDRFWAGLRAKCDETKWDAWAGLYCPVIEYLAAARERVPASWLAALVALPVQEVTTRALMGWQRLLGRARRGGVETWGLVHKSFYDHLSGKQELDLPAAHGRIADRYLRAWGGLDRGLPDVADPERAGCDDGYGLRHIGRHLWEAGRFADLCLVVGEPILRSQLRYFSSYHEALEILKLAVRAADRCRDRAAALRFALAHAGIKAKLNPG
jgi:hypothetical protein